MTRKPEPPLVHNLQTIDPELANITGIPNQPTIPLSSAYTAPLLQINYHHFTPSITPFLPTSNFSLYFWHTTDDLLPFYVGIGPIHTATSRHKYPNNQVTIHQMYRDLCGPLFQCTLILSNLNPYHAQSYQHYCYSFLSSLSHPGCYTQEQSSTPFTNYTVTTPLSPIPLPPESELARWGRKHQLQAKIIKWLTNQQYQKRKKANPTLPLTLPTKDA